MSEEEKNKRKFQFALAKAQVDFEYWFAFAIGMVAVAYAMLAYYIDDLWKTYATYGLLVLAAAFLIWVYNQKEESFKKIRKAYVEN
jgi:membrane protein YdbS with pleckstrin-like domain